LVWFSVWWSLFVVVGGLLLGGTFCLRRSLIGPADSRASMVGGDCDCEGA